MSKARDIWNNGIGSVAGYNLTQELCYKTACELADYANELEYQLGIQKRPTVRDSRTVQQ